MADTPIISRHDKSQVRQDGRTRWANPAGTKTYYAWRSMRQRCTNPKSNAWKNYGGRGISVCERWLNNYDAFVEDMGFCPEGMTLDRIDFNKGYFPENCRWASWAQQGNNKRVTKMITHNGETLSITQWANKIGVGTDTLWRRINVYKMPVEKALSSESLVPKTKCGTRHGYEKGCRCSDCKAAHAKRHRAMRARRKALACGGKIATEGGK